MSDEKTETPEPAKEPPKLAKGALKKKPKMLPASTELLGSFFVRRLSAGRVEEIEKLFPTNADGSCADYRGYQRALMAEAVADENGDAIFTAAELKDDADPGEFWTLWEEVTLKLNMRKAKSGKN